MPTGRVLRRQFERRQAALSPTPSVVHRLTRRARRTAGEPDGRQVVHFLHVGKTGGTAVRAALEGEDTPVYRLKLRGHDTRLVDVAGGEKVFFFVRDPMSRFVSGFCSRRRQGRPRHFVAWSPAEEEAFRTFATANDLAESLYAADEDRRRSALLAMASIGHVRTSFWDWFGDEPYLRSRGSDLLFVGHQETLTSDFERLKELLGVRRSISLPTDDVAAHRGQHGDRIELSASAQQNLRRWYVREYEFLDLLATLRPG